MAVRYVGTVRFFLMVRYVGTVRLFCNGLGTVRWYAVSIKNPGLFALCIGFCMQKQKTDEADVKR